MTSSNCTGSTTGEAAKHSRIKYVEVILITAISGDSEWFATEHNWQLGDMLLDTGLFPPFYSR